MNEESLTRATILMARIKKLENLVSMTSTCQDAYVLRTLADDKNIPFSNYLDLRHRYAEEARDLFRKDLERLRAEFEAL